MKGIEDVIMHRIWQLGYYDDSISWSFLYFVFLLFQLVYFILVFIQ